MIKITKSKNGIILKDNVSSINWLLDKTKGLCIPIKSVYIGTKAMIWSLIRSCFGSGIWISDYNWLNEEIWINE